MMREATERSLAKPTAHAMRAAAIRLARERAGEDPDPAQVYGCVDWYRYDVSSPPRRGAQHHRVRLRAAVPGEATLPPAH